MRIDMQEVWYAGIFIEADIMDIGPARLVAIKFSFYLWETQIVLDSNKWGTFIMTHESI